MADRLFPSDVRTLEHDLRCLFVDFTIGASGAVSSDDSIGCSVTKDAGAGDYTIALEDSYTALKGAPHTIERAAAADSHVEISAEDVSGTTPTINISTVTAGTAANLASGSKVRMTLWLKNSSLTF